MPGEWLKRTGLIGLNHTRYLKYQNLTKTQIIKNSSLNVLKYSSENISTISRIDIFTWQKVKTKNKNRINHNKYLKWENFIKIKIVNN